MKRGLLEAASGRARKSVLTGHSNYVEPGIVVEGWRKSAGVGLVEDSRSGGGGGGIGCGGVLAALCGWRGEVAR